MKRTNIVETVTVWAVLTAFVFSAAGCAQLKDKFVRKRKEEEPESRFYAVRKYDVHPSMELYTKRYIFWKSWHRELLAVLTDDNQKKTVMAAEQATSNLMDMHGMLVDEKAEKLQAIIDEMTEVENQIKKERVTGGNEVRIRKKLEFLGKEVKRDFSYNKVRGLIRTEFR